MSIKDFFQREWAGVADAWRKWGDEVRVQSAAATEWICELAQIRAGMLVLDLASGVGDPALELARRVGPTGRVTATDLVAGPLAFVEQAARTEGLTWLTTQSADMECLPFDDATFDAVTCRLGIMFSAEPARVLREIQRVLKPGGRAALIAWGSHRQPAFSSTLSVIGEYFSPEAAAPPHQTDGPGPFQFELPGSLSSELQAVGFAAVQEEQRVLPWPFRGSAEQFWEMFSELAGPSLRQAVASLEPEKQRALIQRIVDNLRAHQQGSVVDPTALVIGCSAIA